MTNAIHNERFPPPPNMPPGQGYKGQWRFRLRKLADLQVASVLNYLQPWLESISGDVLEVGCGAQPYRHLVPESCHYQGLDWQRSDQHFQYAAKPDTIYYDGKTFPFPDQTFDYVFHTEVLEHVYDKEFFLKECCRVLKPGASFLCTVPFQARYHYIPHDFWRFTPAALNRMLQEAGFCGIIIKPRGNDITVAAYKVISVIYRWLQSGIRGAIAGISCLPLAIIALIIGHLAMRMNLGSTDDCLGYVVTAHANHVM